MILMARTLQNDTVLLIAYQAHLTVVVHQLATTRSVSPTYIARQVKQISVHTLAPFLPQNQTRSRPGIEVVYSYAITPSFPTNPVAFV